ncbi:unnamed protein product [Spodoptera littoralis]|uniref:Fasciclin-2-like n=1 Tax=Spodoptera littoralis TaxID=7109 RepID=A0A9P0HYG2_SPOLI|nr:unnamed protein product [Spodoptera littoralis]CAH1636814.1 unnamed protein product [Spodoptera littoralis]
MMERFVLYSVFVIFLTNDCTGCLLERMVNNRSITTGSSFYEECCCSDDSSMVKELTWLDPYNRIIAGPGTDSNLYTEEQSGCLSLHIPSASKTMSGAYKCMSSYEGKQQTRIHNLDVYDPLYFYGTAMEQYLVFNNNSLITCQANGATPPLIRWYKGEDGASEIYNNTTEKYQIMPEGLIVKNVSTDDEGIYKCSASVLSTGEEVELDIQAKVMTPPVITQLNGNPDSVVPVGESLMIQCSTEGLPEPEVELKKIPEPSPGENKTVPWDIHSKGIIRFNSITPEDAGTYECIAKNFVGEAKQQLTITVLIKPEIIGFTNRSAVEGTVIPMFCNVTGVPIPSVMITFEGKSLDEEKDTDYDEIVENFSLLKVNRSSEGIYICNATNDVDTKTELMYLTVLHQPYFDKTYEPLWAWNGETVNISCAQDSNPPANFTWSFVPGNFSTIERQEHDNIVLDYETTLEHSFPFSEQFAPFGRHECRARNQHGEAVKIFHIRKGSVPSVIINATTIEEAATSATFFIDTPTDYEGPDVIGFIAEYDDIEKYEITNIHPNRTWAVGIPFKLEKLKSNTTYYIRFAAINRVGTGEWSKYLAFETMDKSAPEPPIWQLDEVEISSNKVLKWKAPENNGEPIDYYALRYCPVDEEIIESLCKEHRLEGATELLVNELEHNATYHLELIAHNAEGNSTPANITLTIPDKLTSAPVSVLTAGALIGLSIVVVLICLVLLDILLYFWKKQGIIASCCCKKNKNKKPNPLNQRDKKGLLKDNGESGTDDTLRRPNNGHKEYEYNKTTGIITGKHSSV